MEKILDIHTHHGAPRPNAVVSVRPEDFNPVEGQLYSTGIHPWDTTDDIAEERWQLLENVASHPQVVAIGECGIDLLKGGPLFRQMQVMRRHIDLSERLGKPLVIHCVHAHDIIIGLKRDLKPTQKWMIHGFRGKPTVAGMLADAGMWISSGAQFNEASLKNIPLDRMLAETDESDTPIEDIITRLSTFAGEDLTPRIEENSRTFLMRLMIPLLLLVTSLGADALTLEPIRYADFSQWVKRGITESKVIGGAHKTIYEVAPAAEIEGNKPYVNAGGSPWATSNVYAKVSGVVKGSNTVTPFDRNGDTCARMEAKMEEVKVLGLINMDVMVAGTLFLGRVYEPISSTKGPFSKMEMGVPYTKRPKALVYDFQVDMPATDSRTKSTGFSSKKTLPGRDNAEVYVILQKRWEDSNGKLYARRVGTGRERYDRSKPWTKGHELPIHYGDITGESFYKPWMGLLSGERAYYARNSKGKLVPVEEVGWAPADEEPTHVLVMASSTCGEPFIGTEGLTLYIDNIAFGF